jgi:hypothetical protein
MYSMSLTRPDTSDESHLYTQVNWFQSQQDYRGVLHQVSPPEQMSEQSSHLYATTPPPAQKLREVREPDDIDVELDPMDCHVYLASPIQTIVNSVQDALSEHISLHDVADAYSTLSMRIQDNAYTISHVERALAALELIKARASIVTVALRRDVRRAFVDPLPDAFQPTSSFSSENSMFPQSQPIYDLSEDEIKAARDQYYVCHHALQLLSDIFRFPVLQDLFSGVHLMPSIICPILTSTSQSAKRSF